MNSKSRTPEPAFGRGLKPHVPLDRRYAERAPISCKVIYSGRDGARIIKVEGIVQDLSKTGCKILGNSEPVMGDDLALFLYLEDGKAPLCLAGAKITWVQGFSFAIRFARLSPEERKRLQEVIWKNVTLSPVNNHRTAFRIV